MIQLCVQQEPINVDHQAHHCFSPQWWPSGQKSSLFVNRWKIYDVVACTLHMKIHPTTLKKLSSFETTHIYVFRTNKPYNGSIPCIVNTQMKL